MVRGGVHAAKGIGMRAGGRPVGGGRAGRIRRDRGLAWALLAAAALAMAAGSVGGAPAPGPYGGDAAREALAGTGAPAVPEALVARYRRPDAIPYPPGNPHSPEKARLGEVLFFDPRLSGSNTMSCATCHDPAQGWEDGRRTARGDRGQALHRATQTLLNIAWAEPLMWDGRAESLEAQALGPIAAPEEMDQPVGALVEELSAVPGYRRLFRDAFGDEAVTPDRIASALATYQRGIVSGPAPFDRWIAGEEGAMGPAAVRGFLLFNGRANCAACHAGWRLTDDSFHDIGLPTADPGRGAQMPGVPMLRHAFKTPTLRNIAARAPYMHNGAAATLREAILHYDSGFTERPSLSAEMRRLALTPQDVEDLLAFLHALSSAEEPPAAPALPPAAATE